MPPHDLFSSSVQDERLAAFLTEAQVMHLNAADALRHKVSDLVCSWKKGYDMLRAEVANFNACLSSLALQTLSQSAATGTMLNANCTQEYYLPLLASYVKRTDCYERTQCTLPPVPIDRPISLPPGPMSKRVSLPPRALQKPRNPVGKKRPASPLPEERRIMQDKSAEPIPPVATQKAIPRKAPGKDAEWHKWEHENGPVPDVLTVGSSSWTLTDLEKSLITVRDEPLTDGSRWPAAELAAQRRHKLKNLVDGKKYQEKIATEGLPAEVLKNQEADAKAKEEAEAKLERNEAMQAVQEKLGRKDIIRR